MMKLKSRIKIFLYPLLALSPLFFVWYFVSAPVYVQFESDYVAQAKPSRLMAHVKQLSVHLPERSDDVDKLNVSAAYIHMELSQYSSNVYYQEYGVWGIPYRNVIAEFGDVDCGGVYVIGAHYDSYDGLPGADDNASGVAGLLEFARLLGQSKQSCKFELVAYALEEPPYFRSKDMGSYQHAKKMHDEQQTIALMISLEMIGYFSDEEGSQGYPFPILDSIYPSVGNYISLVSNFTNFSIQKSLKGGMIEAVPLAVHSINAPPIMPGIDFSDHGNYWLFDFPALMVTDTSFYRNARYHTPEDTWDTLDYERMAMVVDGVFSSVVIMSENHRSLD